MRDTTPQGWLSQSGRKQRKPKQAKPTGDTLSFEQRKVSPKHGRIQNPHQQLHNTALKYGYYYTNGK